MSSFRLLSAVEQVAEHLKAELTTGKWAGTMPGVYKLVEELQVSRGTLDAALNLLEMEGLLIGQGAGRGRRIVASAAAVRRPMRIAILPYNIPARRLDYMLRLKSLLEGAGHQAFFPAKTLTELGMNPLRVARLVAQTEAEAWIIGAGSRDVLEWFSVQPFHVFALFGRRSGLPIAGTGPDHPQALRAATRRLIQLGHRRIVVLSRESRRAGGAGSPERAVFQEMRVHGLPVSDYNLQFWEETPISLCKVIDRLLEVTPPSSLIISEAYPFAGIQHRLARRGILAPEHISLICDNPHPSLDWYQPSIAHIRWDSEPVIRRIVRWANNISRGKEDLRQTTTKAEFIEGGTVGPLKAG